MKVHGLFRVSGWVRVGEVNGGINNDSDDHGASGFGRGTVFTEATEREREGEKERRDLGYDVRDTRQKGCPSGGSIAWRLACESQVATVVVERTNGPDFAFMQILRNEIGSIKLLVYSICRLSGLQLSYGQMLWLDGKKERR